MKTNYYDYKLKLIEFSTFFQKQGMKYIGGEFSYEYYVKYHYLFMPKMKRVVITVELCPYNEDFVSIHYSLDIIENMIWEYDEPILKFNVIKIPIDSKKFNKRLKSSFKMFQKILKIYVKNYMKV